MDDQTSVRVALRLRPLVKKETDLNETHNLEKHNPPDAPPQVLVNTDKRTYAYDYVFGPQDTNATLYESAVAPLVRHCFNGYNATVFAYGQTGAGKTYTMGSGAAATEPGATEPGIIPRAVDHLFELLESLDADSEQYALHVSYLEIHNEEVRDLLHPAASSAKTNITIREDAAGDIFVHGVREVAVGSREALLACLEAGCDARTTASTLMNEYSSRSHSLCTIRVQRTSPETASTVFSKLRLVDLAGSERAKKTGTAGQRFKESVTINQGLLALGNVISALGDEKRGASHVPYRESKLTRLLQDSLGGNSHTLMVACVGPAASNLDESLNTLRYANRARNIRNTPVINREDITVGQMRAEISELHSQLAQRHSQPAPSAALVADGPLPLSSELLHALEEALPPAQLQRIVNTLVRLGPGTANSLASSLLASPASTPFGTPKRTPANPNVRASPPASGGAPPPSDEPSYASSLSKLGATIGHWGRFEAARATLLQRLSQGEMDIGSDESERFRNQLQRLAERGQMLQLLAQQQLDALRGALDDEGGDALRRQLDAAESDLATTKAELGEARADLSRDETIFTHKMRELRQLARAHEALQHQHESTCQQVQELQAQLQSRWDQQQLPLAPAAAEAQTPTKQAAGSPSSGYEVSPAREHVDELEALDDVLLGYEDGAHAAGAAAAVQATPLPAERAPATSQKPSHEGPVTEVRGAAARPLMSEYDLLASAQKQLLTSEEEHESPLAATEAALAMQHADAVSPEQANIEDEARELGDAIPFKEQELAQLAAAESASRECAESQATKLRTMSEEIVALQADLERTREEMEEAETRAGRTASQMAEERRRFELRLRKTAAQLDDAQTRRRELEAAQAEKADAQRKLHTLQEELARMKERHTGLREQLRNEKARHGGAKSELVRENLELRREIASRDLRVASLESEGSRQRQMLQRRAEQLQKLQRLKGSTSATQSPRKPPTAPAERDLAEREAAVREREAALAAERSAAASAMELEMRQLRQQLEEARRAAAPLRSDSQVSSANSGADSSPAKLAQPCASPEEELERLGRDNFYYRHSNRELKRRLRSLSEEMERGQAAATTAAERSAALERANAQLRQELDNMRAYIAEHPGSTPVRVNKKALRPIEPGAAVY